MNRSDEIDELVKTIAEYHMGIVRSHGLKEDARDFSKVLPEAEAIDLAALNSARIEYENPIEDDPETVAENYLRLLKQYAETWARVRATPRRIPARRNFTWIRFWGFSIRLPWGRSEK